MKTAVITLNFGEPESPVEEQVLPFLERIFLANASLEDSSDPEKARRRSRDLAERRAPGLVEEYREIGGSPLNRQAHAQARRLGLELMRRGHQAHVYSGMQFTDPLIAEVVRRARADGVERLVGLPVYPLCGPSTNVAALDAVAEAMAEVRWEADFVAVTGWHRHPRYVEIRADGVRETLDSEGLALADPGVRLLFSAHGTPMKYIREGSRYQEYVEEFCGDLARALGTDDYLLGYQNHTNRGVEWTSPDVEVVVAGLGAAKLVVVPVSFMHEQSETLAELDGELAEKAEEAGVEAFHRVPVPHDDPRFAGVLADLVEPLLEGEAPAGQAGFGGGARWSRCRCRPEGSTYCLNGLARTAEASI